MHKQLIVNADDFGFTRGTNEGILEAHRTGILTATTLMAHGDAFDHAVMLAKETPSLDVGVHLVLWDDVWGKHGLPQRLPSFLRQAMRMSTGEIARLFASQVARVVEAGIAPSHLDTHKHTHILPHVMRAVDRTALDFSIGWVRRPLLPLTGRPAGVRTTDHFLGLGLTGKMNQSNLARALDDLQPGVTELMCHPARYDADLEAAPTRLKHERQTELEALTAEEIRAQLDAAGVELTSYHALS